MSVVNFDHPEEYLFPRWAPGSLAEAITQFVDGSLQEAAEEHLRRADAVERMVRAGVRVREARRLWRDPGVNQATAQKAYDDALNELDAAVEAAEKWR
jgi:DNA-binding transcriptional MocR family regulator